MSSRFPSSFPSGPISLIGMYSSGWKRIHVSSVLKDMGNIHRISTKKVARPPGRPTTNNIQSRGWTGNGSAKSSLAARSRRSLRRIFPAGLKSRILEGMTWARNGTSTHLFGMTSTSIIPPRRYLCFAALVVTHWASDRAKAS